MLHKFTQSLHTKKKNTVEELTPSSLDSFLKMASFHHSSQFHKQCTKQATITEEITDTKCKKKRKERKSLNPNQDRIAGKIPQHLRKKKKQIN